MRRKAERRGASCNSPTPVVLLDKEPHANPLRLLELLWKGFCPPIIRDRVEIHEHPQQETSTVDVESQQASVKSAASGTASSCTKDADSSKTPGKKSIRKSRKPPAAPIELSSSAPTVPADKNYFELKERPASDVIGISKAIWEGICQHHHHHHPAEHRHPTNGGFCGCGVVLAEHYRGICLRHLDDGNDVPGGEECSVYSSDASVDLSPQSPTIHTVHTKSGGSDLLSAGPPPVALCNGNGDFDQVTEDDWDCDEEEEEEEEPIVEYYDISKRRSRALQVFVMTVLAVYVTFVLLQRLDTVNSKNFHFALEPKKQNTSNGQQEKGLSNIIRVSKSEPQLHLHHIPPYPPWKWQSMWWIP